MKKYFKLSNLSFLLLVVYIVKSFIVPPTYIDFGTIVLMCLSSTYTLKLNKDKLGDKKQIEIKLAEFEETYNKKLLELQASQEKDRLVYETKFSTLNLGIQRQSKPNQKANYGWNG